MEELKEALNSLKSDLKILITNQSEIKVRVEKIEKMVTGNGEVEKGIAFRLKFVESHVNFVHKFGWIIFGTMATVPPAILCAFLVHVMKIK